jgi:hypothetical protein
MKWQKISMIALLSTLATPAFAQDGGEFPNGLMLEMRIAGHVATDESVDVVSDTNVLPVFHLGVQASIPQVPGLRAGLLFKTSEQPAPSRLGNQLDLDWTWRQFLAVADYGPMLFGFLRPSLRAGLGYGLQSMDVMLNDGAYSDWAHDFAYFASGNVEMTFVAHQSETSILRLGFSGELGYQGQTNASFDELKREDTDEWDRQPPTLGEMNTDGLLWSFGANLIFGF